MADRAAHDELVPPRLPVRASIYIAPDGTVHFGALFADLVSVAEALSAAGATTIAQTASEPDANAASSG